MLIFDVLAPNGKTISVEMPDGSTPEEASRVAQQQYAAQAASAPADGEVPERTWGDVGRDVLVTAAKSAIGLPQSIAGIADIPTLGRAGQTLESIGFRPAEAQKILDGMYSPATQQAKRNVQQAEGFMETLGAAAENPSAVATTVGESLGSMLGGAGVARKVLQVAPTVAPWLAGAIGEGVVGAGSAAAQIREETEDGTLTGKQALAAVGSGVGTGVLGAFGGKLAGKLGVADVDTMLAQGSSKLAQSPAGFVKSVVGSGISEGVFEEMPQSAQEQMWQNYATGKPIMDGVENAAAMGLVAGTVMGGAGGGFNALVSKPREEAIQEEREKLNALRTAVKDEIQTDSIAEIGKAPDVETAIAAATAAVSQNASKSADDLLSKAGIQVPDSSELLANVESQIAALPADSQTTDASTATVAAGAANPTEGLAVDGAAAVAGQPESQGALTFNTKDEAAAYANSIGGGVVGVGGKFVVTPSITPLVEKTPEQFQTDAKQTVQLRKHIPDATLVLPSTPMSAKERMVVSVAEMLNAPLREITGKNVTLIRSAGKFDGVALPGGNYFLNTSRLSGGRGNLLAQVGGVLFHEATHTELENSSDPLVREKYAAVREVVLQYQRDNAAKSRLDTENKEAKAEAEANQAEIKRLSVFEADGTLTEEQAVRLDQLRQAPQFSPVDQSVGDSEFVADVSGGMMISDPEFWKRMYDLDDGVTMRRVGYKFMEYLTKLIGKIPKSSRFNVDSLVTQREAVREAMAQAWTARAQGAKLKSRTQVKEELFRPSNVSMGGLDVQPLSDIAVGVDGPLFSRATRSEMREATPEDRKRLKIPPAYKDVMVAVDPEVDLQWTAMNEGGTKKYGYTDRYNAAQLKEKFERMQGFYEAFPSMMERITKDSEAGNESAIVLRLIALTGFRVGGEVNRSGKPAYGASTLLPKHVSIDGDVLTFDFVGKGQVHQMHSIQDAFLAKLIAGRMDRESLFNANDGQILRYIKKIGYDFKTHDFRTNAATMAAKQAIGKIATPSTPAEFWPAYDEAILKAAVKIGDTRKVAEDTYVDPTIFDQWREAAGVPAESARPKSKRKAGATNAGQPNDVAADARTDGPASEGRGDKVQLSRTEDVTDDYPPGFFDEAEAEYSDVLDDIPSEIRQKINEENAPVEDFNEGEGNLSSVELPDGLVHWEAFAEAIDIGETINDTFDVDGSVVGIELNGRGRGWNGSITSRAFKRGKPLTFSGVNAGGKYIPASRENALKYVAAQAAGLAAEARGFDLLDTVKPAVAKRIADYWTKVAKKPGAKELGEESKTKGLNSHNALRVREIALQKLKGVKVKVTGTNDHIVMEFGEEGDQAEIEITPSKNIVLHAIDLPQAGGYGKMFYSVANEFAKSIGAKVLPDNEGLTAVNTYRRTENQMSSAARSGGEVNVLPGSGQRVHGFNLDDPKGNLARLALAQYRNVLEVFPQFEGTTYDPRIDAFLKDGEVVTSKVKEMAGSDDARLFGMGISSFRRAALTGELLEKKVAVEEEYITPVLYSRSDIGFYSALSEGVNKLTTKVAPANAWKDAIKGLVNKGAAKQDEVEWSGVNDWLDIMASQPPSNPEGRPQVGVGDGISFREISRGDPGKVLSVGGMNIPLQTLADFESSRVQNAATDAELLRNLGRAEAVSNKGFSLLDVPLQRLMVASVRLAIHDLKVLDSVVSSIPVDVMNMLTGEELSPKVLRHNPSVLSDNLAIDKNAQIPISVVKAMNSAMGSAAFSAAEIFSRAIEMRRAAVEILSAKGATDRGHAGKPFGDYVNHSRINKQQILDFLDSNGVKVEEVVLGGSEPNVISNEEALDRLRNGQPVGWRSGDQVVQMHDPDSIVDDDSFYREKVDDGSAEWIDTGTNVGGDVTNAKYGQYTLPGGSNYREVLLTLPKNQTDEAKVAAVKAREISERMRRADTDDEYELLRGERQRLAGMASESPAYKSSHWDQKNVLAHIRVNDRTDADGKRVLFVEEVQSDWGQDGKKKGFAEKAPTLPPGYKAERRRDGKWVMNNPLGGRLSGVFDTEQAAIQAVLARQDLMPGVPQAPFVTKTDGWLNLALKRIITMAVDGGYDSVAFTNGQQNAERFSLDNKIDGIFYTKNGDGTYNVSAANGNSEVWADTRATEQVIEDTLGKEMAERIVNGGGVNEDGVMALRGKDLKIEAKGMRVFYDSIVPNAVKALLKKVGGGQMRTVELDMRQPEDDSWYEELTDADISKQPGFDITPGMIEKAEAGLPMFSRTDSTESTSDKRQTDTESTVNLGGAPRGATRPQRDALARIMKDGVTSPDDLRALLKTPGYSKWARSAIAGDMAGAAALRSELQEAFPGTDWKAPRLNDQGIVTLYSDWSGRSAGSIDKLTSIADKYDAPIAVRGGALSPKDPTARLLRDFDFEPYMGAQERADRMPNVMFSMIRPAGGVTATTPLFSRMSGTQGQNFTVAQERKRDHARRIWQDYFLPILRVQEAITGSGGLVSEVSDVYKAEERMYGRIEEALRDFREKEFEPLIKETKELNLTPDELALYAYAKHAPERNAHIASIHVAQATNSKLGIVKGVSRWPDGGSGMTNAESAAILAQFQNEGKAPDLEMLHAKLMAITNATRLEMLDQGLITQAEYDSLQDMFENYVPLRGLDEDIAQPVRRGGGGYNIRGKETMRALGRRSRAGDILENIVTDYERAVSRGEQNLVGKVFLKLVQDNPDPGLWEIDAIKTKDAWDRQAGKVKSTSKIDTGPDTISVKVDGKEVYIKIHDEGVLRAMRKAFKSEVSGVERFLTTVFGGFNNMLRATLTQYNPVFGFVNWTRDVQMGAVGVLDELGAGASAKFLNPKLQKDAMLTASRFVQGKLGNSAMDKLFQEFRAAGATTGGFYAKDAEHIRGEIRNMMLAMGAAPKQVFGPNGFSLDGLAENIKTGGGTKVGRGAMRSVQKIGGWLEHFGLMTENATRFAAYKVARDMGKTPAEAASIAKNLTTNFNRKGEWGQAMNSAYLFFNAAMQGSARVVKALQNRKVQGLMAGMVAAGAGLAALAMSMGDDDDGQAYWDKIPSHEKERNFIIMLPPGYEMEGAEKVGSNGRYIKIPMPYGFSVFPTLGYVMHDVARNAQDRTRGITPAAGAMRMVSAVMGSFNPFGGAFDPQSPSGVMMAAAPTMADVVIQQAMGRNSFDRPTAPFKGEFDTDPDSENVNPRQAGSVWHMLARGLNYATGGDEATSGKIDVAPGTIENLVKTATGGTGTFLSDVLVNLPVKMFTPNSEITQRDVPLARNFFGTVDGVNDTSLLYERRKAILEAKSKLKNYEDMGLDPKKMDSMDFALAYMSQMSNQYSKAMSAIRKEEIELALDSEMPKGDKALKLKQLKKERDELAADFNAAYMDVMRAERDGDFAVDK